MGHERLKNRKEDIFQNLLDRYHGVLFWGYVPRKPIPLHVQKLREQRRLWREQVERLSRAN